MKKKINYILASMILHDLAESLKEGGDILKSIGEEQEGSIANEEIIAMNAKREEVKKLLPKDRFATVEALINKNESLVNIWKMLDGSRKRRNAERTAQAVELLEQGKTQSEIATILGCSRQNIHNLLKYRAKKTKLK